MPHLITENLGHRYGRQLLFRQLAFELGAGESLAVLGRNGSGKSTLVRVLAGLTTPLRGTVTLEANGTAIPDEARPNHVGLVAPYLGVYTGLTARENLGVIAKARRMPRAEARIDATLARCGLAGRAGDRVATFSSGLLQRVRFATALLAEPALLLLDEPTVTLDAEGRAMARDLAEQHTARGGLLVVATNDPAEAGWCARRLSVEDFR